MLAALVGAVTFASCRHRACRGSTYPSRIVADFPRKLRKKRLPGAI
jgi:hypothetical protein